MARTKALTDKQRNIGARNRANAQKCTGPRTAAGKARSAGNALTHGLCAATPRDARDVADREARAEVLAEILEPGDALEAALVHRVAAALQRLEKCDHLEAQAFDAGLRADQRDDGDILVNDKRCRGAFAMLTRYRASAAHDLRATLAQLREGRRRDAERNQKEEIPNNDNDLPG